MLLGLPCYIPTQFVNDEAAHAPALATQRAGDVGREHHVGQVVEAGVRLRRFRMRDVEDRPQVRPLRQNLSKYVSSQRSNLSMQNGERPSRNRSHSPESQTAAQFEGGRWANAASISTLEIRSAKISAPSAPRSLSMRNVFKIRGQK